MFHNWVILNKNKQIGLATLHSVQDVSVVAVVHRAHVCERESILQRVVVESIGGLVLLQNSVVAVPVLIGDVNVQHQIVVTHHLLHQVVEVSVNVQISLSNSPFLDLSSVIDGINS